MKKYSVRIMPEAIEDLQSIYDYISYTLKSEQNAESQLERLKTEIQNLDILPKAFKTFDKEPWKSRGLKMFPVDNYIVFYIVNDKDKTVNVLRIMYGKMDFPSHWLT